MQICIKQLQQEFGPWLGARKTFEDFNNSTLAPELVKMWEKVLEMEVKNRQLLAHDANAAAKYQELVDSMKIQVLALIEKMAH